MLTKQQIRENEKKFQECQRMYFIGCNSEVFKSYVKPAWDEMYMYVNFCVDNIAKSKLIKKGIYVNDLDGKVTDAVIKIMLKIKDGMKIRKLSSFCYLYTIGEIWNRKQKREDRQISYEFYADWILYKENRIH